MLQCVAPSGWYPRWVDDPLDRLRRDGLAPARPGGVVDDPLQFDEFGPLSIKPQQGWCWAPRGKTRRLRSDYNRRHGVRYLLVAHDVDADYLWGEMTASKDAEPMGVAHASDVQEVIGWHVLAGTCWHRMLTTA